LQVLVCKLVRLLSSSYRTSSAICGAAFTLPYKSSFHGDLGSVRQEYKKDEKKVKKKRPERIVRKKKKNTVPRPEKKKKETVMGTATSGVQRC
jgi:hypothetical protein